MDDWDVTDGSRSLLKTITASSPQWRKIVLDLGVELAEILFSSDGSLQRHFPSLEKLDINCVVPSIHPISFCNAPRLREIFLPSYPTRRPIHFPWAQITTFWTGDIDLSQCIDILTNASNLVNGTFDFQYHDPFDVSQSSIISLHLQSLTLAGELIIGGDSIPMAILNCLNTPALKDLTLQFNGNQPSSFSRDVSPFLSFVSRLSLQLHSLALSLMPTTTETLIQCLKATPSLVHLKLEPPRIVNMNTIFTQLTGNSDFLPKLESLHIFFSFDTGRHFITASVVVDMLCWRWAAVGITQLRSFQMACSSYRSRFCDEEANSEFRRLKKEGMDLYLGMERPDIDSFVTLPCFQSP
ncbi:hypothetical protein B0H13DRAFT_2019159 [Mycena leptocephala]|nr:hypothetical protein B0H13DRAFT_2019159 [Mycena leptocephala]